MTFLQSMFEAFGRVPHCLYYGDAWLTGFHLIPSALIFLAYALISGALFVVWWQRKMPFSGLMLLFVAFIALCGLGHLADDIAIWHNTKAWHWFANVVHTVNAIVSLTAAAYIIKVIPLLVRWPTITEHEDAKRTLEETRAWERAKQLGWPRRVA